LRAGAARRAGVDDAPALVRLRAVMFDAIDVPVGDENADWRLAGEAWFREQLDRPTIFAAFVVDDASSRVVSAGCGICDAWAPGPRGLSGVRGHVFSIATDPRHRRRGYATICLTALLTWFRDDTPADAVELSATSDGVGLYESLGFREREHPTMRLGLSASTETFL
jgi:ribosomal protein S18 acetylase RimI-like enzyme